MSKTNFYKKKGNLVSFNNYLESRHFSHISMLIALMKGNNINLLLSLKNLIPKFMLTC